MRAFNRISTERKHIQSLAFAIESSVGASAILDTAETTKKMGFEGGEAGPACGRKSISPGVLQSRRHCCHIIRCHITQKQVMSCSLVRTRCSPSIIFHRHFSTVIFFQTTNNIMVRASIRDNRRRPRRRLGGGDTVGTENRIGEARLCACGAPAARPGPSHCPEENDCLCKYINHHLSLIVCLV